MRAEIKRCDIVEALKVITKYGTNQEWFIRDNVSSGIRDGEPVINSFELSMYFTRQLDLIIGLGLERARNVLNGRVGDRSRLKDLGGVK